MEKDYYVTRNYSELRSNFKQSMKKENQVTISLAPKLIDNNGADFKLPPIHKNANN